MTHQETLSRFGSVVTFPDQDLYGLVHHTGKYCLIPGSVLAEFEPAEMKTFTGSFYRWAGTGQVRIVLQQRGELSVESGGIAESRQDPFDAPRAVNPHTGESDMVSFNTFACILGQDWVIAAITDHDLPAPRSETMFLHRSGLHVVFEHADWWHHVRRNPAVAKKMSEYAFRTRPGTIFPVHPGRFRALNSPDTAILYRTVR